MFDSRSTQDLTPPLEQKSYACDLGSALGNAVAFPDYLAAHGAHDLSAYASIALYMQCMPLFNAISLRAEFLSQVPIRLKNVKTKEFVEDHPVLDLLSKPNSDLAQEEFLEQLSSFYDITGEVFVAATGRLTREPLELICVGPQYIQFGTVAKHFGLLNLPLSLTINQSTGEPIVFKVREEMKYGVRYVTADEASEMWHIRAFNPLRSSTNFRGLSKAKPIWYEIQQYVSGNVANLSNLKRGSRISMAWVNVSGQPLTDDQWVRMNALAKQYSGEQSAGGTPVLDGMDVKPIQQTNKDMEFQALQKAMLARISSVYRVPLALLLPESMTLDNLKTSYLQLFDGAILPQATRLFSELTRLLMPRYKNAEDLELCYSEQDIPALRERIVNIAKAKAEVDVNTIDEIRDIMGDPSLPKGGDKVFRPMGLVAVGEDEYDDSDLDVDIDVTDEDI